MVPLWKKLREREVSATDLRNIFGIDEPPVPVLRIASGMGIEIYYRENAGWDGALDIDERNMRARIFVEKNHPVTRQRFTVAHELGHVVMHPHTHVHRDTAGRMNSDNFIEWQANRFAARLLMPEWMVRFAYNRVSTDVSQLARSFVVSREAMRIRLQSLGLARQYHG